MLSAEDNTLLTRTGRGTPMGELLRRFWVPALLSSEVPEPDGAPVRVRILGEDLVAFRDTRGRVGLLDAYCPHRGAPLFFGRNEECGLRCAYHGWKFDLDGRCLDMPNEPPESTFRHRVRTTAYPTREAGGLVWAYLGPPGPRPQMPGLEWLAVPASHVHVDKYLVESNYLQALEGDHDSSHASILHSTLENSITDEWLAARTRFNRAHMADKAPRLFVVDTDYGLMTGARRNAGDGLYLWRLVSWLVPFYSLIAQEPGNSLILNVRVPVDDDNSWFYRVHYHPLRPLAADERAALTAIGSVNAEVIPGTFRCVENLDNDYLIDREQQRTRTFSGIRSIPAQDRAVSERMAPVPGHPGIADRSREHLGSADATIIRIRRLLLRAVRDLQAGTAPAAAADGARYRVRAPALVLPEEMAFEAGAAPYLHGDLWEPQDLDAIAAAAAPARTPAGPA
ncbi:hypothetical protein BJF78_04330 [Pseudonocardia sp. CNS-139]|nr:hypothetical protein BJF78_04330 [Pseudonocardia sp. CNS-139]